MAEQAKEQRQYSWPEDFTWKWTIFDATCGLFYNFLPDGSISFGIEGKNGVAVIQIVVGPKQEAQR